MKSKHILLKDMTNAEYEYPFACLLVSKIEKNAIEKVILLIYKDNI